MLQKCPHHRPATDSAPEAAPTVPMAASRRRPLGTTLISAALTAVAAFVLILTVVAAGPQPQSEPDRAQHQLYLPMVAVSTSQTARASSVSPDAAITVEARVSQACKPTDAKPVSGARITVVTNESSATTTTNALGHAVFGATGEPARILIEWPSGLIPCPNSQPIIELPDGNGAVEFVAQAYP
jgi:hypothetical protein